MTSLTILPNIIFKFNLITNLLRNVIHYTMLFNTYLTHNDYTALYSVIVNKEKYKFMSFTGNNHKHFFLSKLLRKSLRIYDKKMYKCGYWNLYLYYYVYNIIKLICTRELKALCKDIKLVSKLILFSEWMIFLTEYSKI